VGKLGYATPWGIAGAVISAVANGLFSTFSPSTSTGRWIGYQILTGIGRGPAMQVPMITVQAALSQNLISISMSLLMFTQMLGGSVFLTLSDTVFTNSLHTYLETYAKGVSPQAIIQAGATRFRSLPIASSPADLAGILMAYSKSVDDVFYMTAGCSCACFLFAWGMGWTDIRKKPETVSDTIEKAEA
jgi:hypothetical protein